MLSEVILKAIIIVFISSCSSVESIREAKIKNLSVKKVEVTEKIQQPINSKVVAKEQKNYSLRDDHNYKNKKGTYKVGRPYYIDGKEFWPKSVKSYVETGVASWYGTKFYNKKTANGEVYKTGDMTAAHRILPLPSLVEVKNLENGRKVILKVNDRGPFVKHNDRIIDVSEEAAIELGFHKKGTAKVEVTLLVEASKELNRLISKNNSKHFTDSFFNKEYNKKNKHSKGHSSVKTEFYRK